MIDETKTKKLINEIKDLVINSKMKINKQVNLVLLETYWNVGRIIVEYEQNGNIKAEYGKKLLGNLSKELTNVFSKGFSRSNLQYMRLFYLNYQKCQTVSGKLSWSHYCELLTIENSDKRKFYEKECVEINWSVRELKRQLNTSYYERTLITSKREIITNSEEQEILNRIKDPYVL